MICWQFFRRTFLRLNFLWKVFSLHTVVVKRVRVLKNSELFALLLLSLIGRSRRRLKALRSGAKLIKSSPKIISPVATFLSPFFLFLFAPDKILSVKSDNCALDEFMYIEWMTLFIAFNCEEVFLFDLTLQKSFSFFRFRLRRWTLFRASNKSQYFS